MLAVFFICQRHHITYHFQLRRPPADAKSCAFIKTVPNPSEKTGQLYCGRQCRKQKGATPAQPQQIKQHPEWFPAPLKASDRRWQALAENNHFLSSDHLHNITEVAIHRLEQQLGKPYVWGGTRPDQGFDCSGLVFYAYNKILEAKLPRTANEMYHYHRATIVANNDLRRGDLLFFHIHSREIADHMGVYLGDGQFIESPRTGETIRVSRLAEPFWQDHFLGARRILTEETIL